MLNIYRISSLGGQIHNITRGRRAAICETGEKDRQQLLSDLKSIVRREKLNEYGLLGGDLLI